VSKREWKPGDVVPVRPLVVIDPEDAEQVERLYRAIFKAFDNDDVSGIEPEDAVSMRAALREFANPTPSKPDEPTGRYAVVEDDQGVEHVRVDAGGGEHAYCWQTIGMPYAESRYARWSDLSAVRVLSHGVTEGDR
jgi:hypothetical protein